MEQRQLLNIQDGLSESSPLHILQMWQRQEVL